MAEIAQVGNADIVDSKDKDRVLAALHPAAFVMKCRNDIHRYISNRRGDFLPVLASTRQSMEDNRLARRDMDAAVRAVLVAGGDDVLRQSGARQVERAVRIGKDSSSFRRCDLKGRVAEPLKQDRSGTSGGNPQKSDRYDFQVVAKVENARREGEQ